MSDYVIKAEKIGKSYMIGHQSNEKYVALRDIIANNAKQWWSRIRNPHYYTHENIEEFWALKEIDFEIKSGERVGIIGRNGAGKSTLLKILSRITEPTQGRIRIKGRIASLLEVGTGFHPELTARENIFLNGAILGMSRNEVTNKFDEIINFAGVEKFLDTPVKRFSSGMYVRLAFAVAAHLESDILLVDEVLAVGDIEFQKKCLDKMSDISSDGRTILFVSHNMAAIDSICNTTIMLQDGSINYFGNTKEAIRRYAILPAINEGISLESRTDRYGNGLVKISECSIFNDTLDQKISEIMLGDEINIALRLHSKIETKVWIGIKVIDENSQVIISLNGKQRGFIPLVKEGYSSYKIHIPFLPLLEGNYSLTFVCSTMGINEACDVIEGVAHFKMFPKDIYHSTHPYSAANGKVFFSYNWLEEN
jgi:lipopolysaccharide transport system ATP-binding protein